MTELASYSSEEELDNTTENCMEVNEVQSSELKKRKRREHEWELIATYENKEDALKKLNEDKLWTYHFQNKGGIGKKVYYRCNKVKTKGIQCDAAVHLLYHSDSFSVSIFKTIANHNHEEINANPGGSKRVPKRKQVATYLKYLRDKKFGPVLIKLSELENWCKTNNTIPDDKNEPFVVSYQILYDVEYDDDDDVDGEQDEYAFRFFVTTKRLIELSEDKKIIHADATYKLIWQGFPVLLCGTTDADRKFHPFGIQVSTNERAADFCDYFKGEWLDNNSGWYNGFLCGPSTNNAIEATNNVIKEHYTYREKLPMRQFLDLLKEIIHDWSYERDETNVNAKLFSTSPTIDMSLWEQAYKWTKSDRKILFEETKRGCEYYFASSETAEKGTEINKTKMNAYIKYMKTPKFNDFDDFSSKTNAYWNVTMPLNCDEESDRWKEAQCNCPTFFKTYICKHIIGIAMRNKYTKVPRQAKDVVLGVKPKRGRKKKNAKALIVE